jgi:hypothetical protein
VRGTGAELLAGNMRALGGLTLGTVFLVRRIREGEAKCEVWDGSHRLEATNIIIRDNKPEDQALIASLATVKCIVMK